MVHAILQFDCRATDNVTPNSSEQMFGDSEQSHISIRMHIDLQTAPTLPAAAPSSNVICSPLHERGAKSVAIMICPSWHKRYVRASLLSGWDPITCWPAYVDFDFPFDGRRTSARFKKEFPYLHGSKRSSWWNQGISIGSCICFACRYCSKTATSRPGDLAPEVPSQHLDSHYLQGRRREGRPFAPHRCEFVAIELAIPHPALASSKTAATTSGPFAANDGTEPRRPFACTRTSS